MGKRKAKRRRAGSGFNIVEKAVAEVAAKHDKAVREEAAAAQDGESGSDGDGAAVALGVRKRRKTDTKAGADTSVHPRLMRARQRRKQADSDAEDDSSEDDEDLDADAGAEGETDAEEGEGEGEDESGAAAAAAKAAPKTATPRWKNRQRTLVFSSRGVSYRARHLLTDLRALMPHSKKDAKLDRKDRIGELIPEICELKNCNNCVYFEMRKKQDLYMWVAKVPTGPSIKFLVENVHTMDELKLTGNCLKGSRPLLHFDENFDTQPHWKIVKELFFQVFGTPRYHPKSKPFVDRILAFYILDGRIWARNYQINWKGSPETPKETSLTEIGPRFVLNPIRMFEGTFGGPTLYENADYISPNAHRASVRAAAGQKYKARMRAKQDLAARTKERAMPKDEVEEVFEDANAAAMAMEDSDDGSD